MIYRKKGYLNLVLYTRIINSQSGFKTTNISLIDRNIYLGFLPSNRPQSLGELSNTPTSSTSQEPAAQLQNGEGVAVNHHNPTNMQQAATSVVYYLIAETDSK